MTEHEEAQGQTEGGALRKQLEEALGELKQYKARERTRTISDALRDGGFHPEAIDMVPESVKPDEIGSWLEAKGHLLAKAETPKQPEPVATEVEAGEPIPAEDLEAMRRFAGGQGGQSPTDGGFEAELAKASTPAELNALFAKYGGRGTLVR